MSAETFEALEDAALRAERDGEWWRAHDLWQRAAAKGGHARRLRCEVAAIECEVEHHRQSEAVRAAKWARQA